MAICGCDTPCSCTITPGDNIVVSGSGETTDPYVISGTEAVFSAVNTDNTVGITPGGSYGHSPAININVSGDGGNVLSKHADGLYVGATALAVATRYIGELIDVTGLTTPGLTLEADATEHAVATYSALAVEYGATGIGDGIWDNHPQLGLPAAGNFRVPDLRDRTTIGRGTFAGAVGATDAITEASRTNTHTHTGPSHSHSFTPSGTNGAVTSGVITDTVTEANQFHTGFIVRDTGVNSLCVDVDLVIDETSFAPSLAAGCDGSTKDKFTKAAHAHSVPAQAFTGSADTTGAAGTGATGAATIPYATVRKVVFAGA